MKVLTILGTRPEIIRLSAVMKRLDEASDIEHILVHTGQNYDYELNEIFFEDLEVRSPDEFLNVSRESLGKAYGEILSKSEEVLIRHRPDAVLCLGDTNSAISAIIAKRMHIPVFHMEAGNRSFDPNVPEEVNRKIVDHTADFNLVYTEHARRHLLSEGLSHRRIYLTGSPMNEVIKQQMPKIVASGATEEVGLEPKKFFLVSAHREENVDDPRRLTQLVDALDQLHPEFGLPTVVSLHPRTRKRLQALGLTESDNVRFHPPFGFSSYCRLQLDSACVLSDSGTITEEASLLRFPAVTLRSSIERPEGLDTGSIAMAGVSKEFIIPAIRAAMSTEIPQPPADYQITDTSLRVINLIRSLAPLSNTWAGIAPRTED